MLGRVVERVAHPDALENQFRRLADDLGVARLTAAEGARVDFSEPLAEHIGEDLGRIEQESLPTPAAYERSLASGTLERIHHALYVEVRENAGREASPTTA